MMPPSRRLPAAAPADAVMKSESDLSENEAAWPFNRSPQEKMRRRAQSAAFTRRHKQDETI